jgi:hypothetical protein
MEAVLADQEDQSGGGADDRLSAHAGAFTLDFALETYKGGEPEGSRRKTRLALVVATAAGKTTLIINGLHGSVPR